jgi:hypothetical protein
MTHPRRRQRLRPSAAGSALFDSATSLDPQRCTSRPPITALSCDAEDQDFWLVSQPKCQVNLPFREN